MVIIIDTKNNPLYCQARSYLEIFLTSMLWIKANKLVNVYRYTNISIKTILGFGGIWSRMVGIRATKAIISAAIDAILSAKFSSWKKIPKLIIAKSHKGRNIVAKATTGNLYKGILKWAYWKCRAFFHFYFYQKRSYYASFYYYFILKF